MKKLKRILLMAVIGLSLLPLGAAAQRMSHVDSLRMRQHGMSGFSDFNAADYKVQKRYRPWEGDTAWSKKWWNHLEVGGMAGAEYLHNYLQTTLQMPVSGFVGYRFTPIHGIRLQAGYRKVESKRSNGGYNVLSGELQYLVNLSNFLYGYNRRRHFETSTLLSLGTSYFSDAKNGDAPYHRLAPYYKVGLEFDYNLGANLSLFAQPYVGLQRSERGVFAEIAHDKYNVIGGANVGIKAQLNGNSGYYNDKPLHQQAFFYEAQTGLNQSFNSMGLPYSGNYHSMAIGRWYSPFIGVRIAAFGDQRYWNKKEGRTSYRKSFAEIGGRAEIMLDLMNMSKQHRNSKEEQLFDLNLSLGGQMGAAAINGTIIHGTSYGRGRYFYGGTGAVQALVKVSPGTYLYAEPRFGYVHYDSPYGAYNAKGELRSVKNEGSMNLSLGARIYAAPRSVRALNDGAFERHWWTAFDFGGFKLYQNGRFKGEGMKLQPALGASIGYDLHPLASFRLQSDINVMARGGYPGLVRTRYTLLDMRAMYMMSVSNLLRGYDSDNKFQSYIETGPTLSLYVAQQRTKVRDRRDDYAPGWMAGVLMAYNVAPRWDVMTEVQGQVNLKKGFTPPRTGGRMDYAHNLKYGVYLGTRYHFLQRSTEDIERLHLDIPEYMKGWFVEAATGWIRPFGSRSGSDYKVSFGRWFSPLFGVRLGVRAQQYYNPETQKGQTIQQAQVAALGHIELMTSPLNWFSSMRASANDRKYDVNIFFGAVRGLQASNHSGIASVGKSGNEFQTFTGLTAGVQALYSIAPGVQLYVEPNVMSTRITNITRSYDKTNYPFTISAGARITRPDGAHAALRRGESGEAKEGGLDTYFKPSWWVALEAGGSKQFKCEKYSAKGGMTAIQPTMSLSVGRDLTSLSTVRLQLETSMMNRIYEEPDGKHYNMTDLRLSYMVNMTNLWRSTRINPFFSFYPGFGLAYGHKTFSVHPQKALSNKNTFGLVGNVMGVLRVAPRWDVTLESLIQHNFTKSYMNQHHDREANEKWNFTIGTRWHF